MASFNKVILMGNLTRDPELKVSQGGLSVCKFSLAVNRSYTTGNGEKKDEVTFVEIDSFGKQAETVAKYLSKGKPILIEGRLKLDQWQDKNSGEKRSRLGVVLESFQFVGGKEGAEQSSDNQDEPPAPSRTTRQPAPIHVPPRPAPTSFALTGVAANPDDDVPF